MWAGSCLSLCPQHPPSGPLSRLGFQPHSTLRQEKGGPIPRRPWGSGPPASLLPGASPHGQGGKDARTCLCTGCRLDSALGQGCSCLVLTPPPLAAPPQPHSSSPSAARALGCWRPAGPFSAPAQEGVGSRRWSCSRASQRVQGGARRVAAPPPTQAPPRDPASCLPNSSGPCLSFPPLPPASASPLLPALPPSPHFPLLSFLSPFPLPLLLLFSSLPSPSPSPPSFLLLG